MPCFISDNCDDRLLDVCQKITDFLNMDISRSQNTPVLMKKDNEEQHSPSSQSPSNSLYKISPVIAFEMLETRYKTEVARVREKEYVTDKK